MSSTFTTVTVRSGGDPALVELDSINMIVGSMACDPSDSPTVPPTGPVTVSMRLGRGKGAPSSGTQRRSGLIPLATLNPSAGLWSVRLSQMAIGGVSSVEFVAEGQCALPVHLYCTVVPAGEGSEDGSDDSDYSEDGADVAKGGDDDSGDDDFPFGDDVDSGDDEDDDGEEENEEEEEEGSDIDDAMDEFDGDLSDDLSGDEEEDDEPPRQKRCGGAEAVGPKRK